MAWRAAGRQQQHPLRHEFLPPGALGDVCAAVLVREHAADQRHLAIPGDDGSLTGLDVPPPLSNDH